jgi:hypothetical protein
MTPPKTPQAERDPRVNPRVGDVCSFRDKPSRTVTKRFTDACGSEWVDYTITKQIRLEGWKRTMKNSRVWVVSV